MSDYLDHLNTARWQLVKHLNGKGIEVSDNAFVVFPKAVKILHHDKPEKYKDYNRFVLNNFRLPKEIDDDSLDYVFITFDKERVNTREINFTQSDVNAYFFKLKEGGRLIWHHYCEKTKQFKVDIWIRNTPKHFTPNFYDKCVPYKEPILPEKNVGIVRLGAIGDLLQTASVVKALKKQGYHTTVYAQKPASEVLYNNLDIDVLVETERDIIRNAELRPYWDYLATTHAKFVNLCGTVEDALLPGSTRPQFYWPVSMRNRYLNHNYVEFMHNVAEVPYKLNVKFYPTAKEVQWAINERKKIAGKKIICYSLSGSSLHKTWPYLDQIIARTMLMLPDVDIVLLGGEREQMLQGGWQEEPRVHCMSGLWSIRESLTFVQTQCNILIGPETGVLNAMCQEPFKKILYLSHSSVNNLSRDWINTISLSPPVGTNDDCLHRLHQNDEEWKFLKRDEVTGAHYGQSKIDPEIVWNHIYKELK